MQMTLISMSACQNVRDARFLPYCDHDSDKPARISVSIALSRLFHRRFMSGSLVFDMELTPLMSYCKGCCMSANRR